MSAFLKRLPLDLRSKCYQQTNRKTAQNFQNFQLIERHQSLLFQ